MVRASLHSVAEAPVFYVTRVDENAGYPGPVPQPQLAENLEQHIEQTLKIHHDEPAEPSIDPTLAECIRIPLGRDDVFAELYIRECDGTACVIYSGEVVVTIDDELSRHSAISAAVHAFYQYLMGTGEQSKKILAGRLNAYIANTIDDPTKIVPASKSCEWPMVEVVAPDIDAITKELQEWPGEEPEGLPTGDQPTSIDDLLGEPPAGDAAVEIVALAEGEDAGTEACGEEGVVGVREMDDLIYEAASIAAKEIKARQLFDRALAAAKDSYVAASQYRVGLQADVKDAKKDEADRLEEIGRIENRGWRHYLPSKANPAAAANESPAPSIPSHESTLPPPSPEHSETPSSPQAGAAVAATQAPPAGGYRDDWQTVSIDELGLSKSLATKLKAAGCNTIGETEAFRVSPGLNTIDGIGEKKIQAIEDAMDVWILRNRKPLATTAAHEAAVAGESVSLEMAAQGQ